MSSAWPSGELGQRLATCGRAALTRRCFAAAFDWFFLTCVVLGFAWWSEQRGEAVTINGCLPFLFVMFLYITYFAIAEWAFGGTLGKLLFGVTPIRVDGRTFTLGTAFMRHLLNPIDHTLYGLVAFLLVRMGKTPQRLGDHLAGTVVVRKSDMQMIEEAMPARLPWDV